MQYDYLIVGSGLFGAVFARQARDAGKKVLVIFGGRLGTYSYYDMDVTIAKALEAAEAELGNN